MGVDTGSGRGGPLAGVRVLEIEGLGPCPFAAMLLGDMGADVIRIRRPGVPRPDFMPDGPANALERSRLGSIFLDLKQAQDRDALLHLVAQQDALLEGFRPGTMERLGLGPQKCLAMQPRLVYGRMTGWGQEGPLARTAGHDINYLGLTGALHAIGRRGGRPVPPLSLVGDYGGGGMLLVAGVLAALLGAMRSGRGRVVDAAIIDGVSLLMSSLWARFADGSWTDERGTNLLDGGAPYYDVYATKDSKFVAVGALEPHYFANLVRMLGLEARWDSRNRNDRNRWDDMRKDFAGVFQSRTQEEWMALCIGADACVSPVLSLAEAPLHAHHRARGTYAWSAGAAVPKRAPRFSEESAASGAMSIDDYIDSLNLPAMAAARLRAKEGGGQDSDAA